MADPNRDLYAAPFGALPASSIVFVAVADNMIPVLVDAMAAGIQSGDRVQFNFGAQCISSSAIAGVRGIGYRDSAAAISGIRLLPGSGTFSGTATLILS